MAAGPAGRRVRGLAVAAMAVAVLAGCAGSGYTYHANKDEKLYFKLPDDWTVYDTNDLLKDNPAAAAHMWVRGFVAGTPSIDAVFTPNLPEPRGYVQILTLDPMERDGLSLATLRATNFGTDETSGAPIDPLMYAANNPNGRFEMLDYDDVVLDGPHGVHLRVAVHELAGDGIIDQTVLVDKATTKRYVLSIGCSPECFKAHESEINAVIKSWTLEAT
jgi:hypothetical protein